jgi:hypothetical protein
MRFQLCKKSVNELDGWFGCVSFAGGTRNKTSRVKIGKTGLRLFEGRNFLDS